MTPEPEPIDLSALDPSREPRWDAAVARVAQRARDLRRLRRTVVRRGIAAGVLVAAAALMLWLAPRPRPPAEPSLLDWAVRDVTADDVLALGGNDAY